MQWPVILKLFLYNPVSSWRHLYFCHTAKRWTMDWDGIMEQGLWHMAYCILHNRHISVFLEAWPVTESQSVSYENKFSVLYDDAIGFTTLLLTLWKKNLTRVNCDKFPKFCRFLAENGSTQPHTHGMTHCPSPQRTIYRPLWRIQDDKTWWGARLSSEWEVSSLTCHSCSQKYIELSSYQTRNVTCSTFLVQFLV